MDIIHDEEQTEEEFVESYQELINSGIAWKLEGSVGRQAMALIEDGFCTLGEKSFKDYWGNKVPSKHEVQPGSKGSQEYVDAKQKERDGG
jgi:hypothetical protein